MFEDTHEDYARDDIRLMFSCLTAQLPLDKPEITALEPPGADEFEETHEPETDVTDALRELSEEDGNGAHDDALVVSPRWQGLLDEFKEIPAESTDWNTSDLFVHRLTQLIKSKLEERIYSGERLRLAIEELRAQFSEELEAFGSDIATTPNNDWDFNLCPMGETSQLATIVERLSAAFGEFDQIHQKQVSRATRPAERRSLREQAEQVQNEIETLYHTVTAKLSPRSATQIEVPEEPSAETPSTSHPQTKATPKTSPRPETPGTKTEAAPEPESSQELLPSPGSDIQLEPEPELPPEPEPGLPPVPEPLPDHSVFTFPTDLSSARDRQ